MDNLYVGPIFQKTVLTTPNQAVAENPLSYLFA